jgi:predicted Holliday junction resolvase-like endonuclease
MQVSFAVVAGLLAVALVLGLGAGFSVGYLAQERARRREDQRWEERLRQEKAVVFSEVEARIANLEKVHQEEKKIEIKQAVERSLTSSRNVFRGQVAERMAPMLKGFPYLPSDAHFLGSPIDYVVFNGYAAMRDKRANGEEVELVILDIKAGGASLSKDQYAIGKAIEAGRMRFEVVRVYEDGTIKRHDWKMLKRKS